MISESYEILPKSLTIYDLHLMEQALQECMTREQLICINLRDLEELDGAGIQWLISLEVRGFVENTNFKITHPNLFCQKFFSLFGFNNELKVLYV